MAAVPEPIRLHYAAWMAVWMSDATAARLPAADRLMLVEGVVKPPSSIQVVLAVIGLEIRL